MADYLGTRAVGSTVRLSFTTHAAAGGVVAPLSAFEAADLRIYKNGSATQRSSAAGITMTSPFDSVVGSHHVDIDLSDDTDAGFYAAGGFYEVHLVPDETVDGQTVVKVLAYFDIGVKAVNVTQLNGSASAAAYLSASSDSMYLGTITGGTPTTTTFIDTGAPGADNDHWKGRVVIFLTGDLAKQVTSVSAFDTSTGEFTVAALSSAPDVGDTFIII
jgi:hypothetical protein